MENMATDGDIGSHNTYVSNVNEARPEVDEYQIGDEGSNPPIGGNYYHVNEGYGVSVRGDLDSINVINFIPHENAFEEGYDEDDIDEFEPYYEIEALDNNYETVLYADLTVEELFDYFPQSVVNDIIDRDKTNAARLLDSNRNEYRIEDILYRDTTPSDIDDVEEVNAIAKKIQTNGPSSYLLTDGDIISFPDHIYINSIDGMTPDKFIALGNIRLGNGGFELIKEPTAQQMRELKQWIRQNNGEMYVDFCEESNQTYPRTLFSTKYMNPNPQRVINDIYYYFEDGIKPQDNFYESKEGNMILENNFVSPEEIKRAIKFMPDRFKNWAVVIPNSNMIPKYFEKRSRAMEFKRWYRNAKVVNLDKYIPLLGENVGKEKILKNIINESQESKSISAAKKLVMQKLGYNEQEADEFIRVKLRNDLPVLRTPQGGKFILGVTRMFCDGELRTANDIGNLNSTLKLVASDAHINEYDRNLNGMHCQELVQRFSKAISDNIEAEKEEINQMTFDTPSNYEIVRIDSFGQAEEYGQYTSWCVTHDGRMFDSYTSNGINQFYFCLRHGFKNVERRVGENCPLDEYGLSMIAVSVNENGMLNTCTCRWNHDNGGNDNIMDAKGVSQVIGMNFFNVFKPNNKWKEILNVAMQRLASGEDPRDVFDYYYDDFHEGFARVKLNGKYNFINQEGKILSNQWFDYCYDFKDGFSIVRLNGKFNFITQEGKFLSNQWFDYCYNFKDGFARVELNDRCNFINQEGKILSNQWFDDSYNFKNGFAWVILNGKRYKIDTNGKLMESKKSNKSLIITEEQLETIKENLESEVDASEINLSSFKKRHELAPNIWKSNDTLDSKIRLRLLDIADDFWKFVNLTWVEPKGIILTGSICNYNWSQYSDIDLHLIVDFNEIDEKTEFVRDYLDAKKNEWNNEHNALEIMGYKVELYVQNIDETPNSNGIYDLEENEWLKEPSQDDIKQIGLEKFQIKDKAAKFMTIIDDMYDALASTSDSHKIEEIGADADYLWKKVKEMRKNSLADDGEMGSGNICYKYLRRVGYLDKLWKLRTLCYDKTNSINECTSENKYFTESIKKYLTLLKEKASINEEFALDGNTEHNPYSKRWKAEREALKNYVSNFGTLMQSIEDNKMGKLYKVFYDKGISQLIGYNYCLCVQWDEMNNKPKSVVYVRAMDKFSPNIRRNVQFDARGMDNQLGTYDDLR